DPAGVVQRPPQRDRPADVVSGQRQPVESELVGQTVDRLAEEIKGVPDVERLVRGAEAGQVGRDDAMGTGYRWQPGGPQVRRGWPTVQQQHGWSAAGFAVGDGQAAVELDRVHGSPRGSQTNRLSVCKLADRRSVYHPVVEDLRIQKGAATRERLVAAAY